MSKNVSKARRADRLLGRERGREKDVGEPGRTSTTWEDVDLSQEHADPTSPRAASVLGVSERSGGAARQGRWLRACPSSLFPALTYSKDSRS